MSAPISSSSSSPSSISTSPSTALSHLIKVKSKDFQDLIKTLFAILDQYNTLKGDVEPIYTGLYDSSNTEIAKVEAVKFSALYTEIETKAKTSGWTKYLDVMEQLNLQTKDLLEVKSDSKDYPEALKLLETTQTHWNMLKEVSKAIYTRSEKTAKAIDYLIAVSQGKYIKAPNPLSSYVTVWIPPAAITRRAFTPEVIAETESSASSSSNETTANPLRRQLMALIRKLNTVIGRVDVYLAAFASKTVYDKNYLLQQIDYKIKNTSATYEECGNDTRNIILEYQGAMKTLKGEVDNEGKPLLQNIREAALLEETQKALIVRCERAAKAIEAFIKIREKLSPTDGGVTPLPRKFTASLFDSLKAELDKPQSSTDSKEKEEKKEK